jgi:putative tricarboxylic transport membrane protein
MLNSSNKKISLILVLVSIAYLVASFRLPSYPYVPIDSDAVPITLGFILLFLSILLFFVKDNHTKETKLPKGEIKVILTVLAFLLIYIMFFDGLGFVVATTLFIFFNSWFLGYKRWVSNLIVSVSIPLFIYLLFSQFLRIQLPQGILPF